MCKQGVVQNLSQRQAPNLLAQVKNQLKQVDQEAVDLFILLPRLRWSIRQVIFDQECEALLDNEKINAKAIEAAVIANRPIPICLS